VARKGLEQKGVSADVANKMITELKTQMSEVEQHKNLRKAQKDLEVNIRTTERAGKKVDKKAKDKLKKIKKQRSDMLKARKDRIKKYKDK